MLAVALTRAGCSLCNPARWDTTHRAVREGRSFCTTEGWKTLETGEAMRRPDALPSKRSISLKKDRARNAARHCHEPLVLRVAGPLFGTEVQGRWPGDDRQLQYQDTVDCFCQGDVASVVRCHIRPKFPHPPENGCRRQHCDREGEQIADCGISLFGGQPTHVYLPPKDRRDLAPLWDDHASATPGRDHPGPLRRAQGGPGTRTLDDELNADPVVHMAGGRRPLTYRLASSESNPLRTANYRRSGPLNCRFVMVPWRETPRVPFG